VIWWCDTRAKASASTSRPKRTSAWNARLLLPLVALVSTHSFWLYRCHWVAFFTDCEHEIEPVKSGHRLTLQYNLYFGYPPNSPELDSYVNPRLTLTWISFVDCWRSYRYEIHNLLEAVEEGEDPRRARAKTKSKAKVKPASKAMTPKVKPVPVALVGSADRDSDASDDGGVQDADLVLPIVNSNGDPSTDPIHKSHKPQLQNAHLMLRTPTLTTPVYFALTFIFGSLVCAEAIDELLTHPACHRAKLTALGLVLEHEYSLTTLHADCLKGRDLMVYQTLTRTGVSRSR
jgi:hypothetical protein